MSVAEVTTARQEQSDAELFAGAAPAAAAQAHLAYFGGPLLQHVQVYNIFWGKKWAAGPARQSRPS